MRPQAVLQAHAYVGRVDGAAQEARHGGDLVHNPLAGLLQLLQQVALQRPLAHELAHVAAVALVELPNGREEARHHPRPEADHEHQEEQIVPGAHEGAGGAAGGRGRMRPPRAIFEHHLKEDREPCVEQRASVLVVLVDELGSALFPVGLAHVHIRRELVADERNLQHRLAHLKGASALVKRVVHRERVVGQPLEQQLLALVEARRHQLAEQLRARQRGLQLRERPEDDATHKVDFVLEGLKRDRHIGRLEALRARSDHLRPLHEPCGLSSLRLEARGGRGDGFRVEKFVGPVEEPWVAQQTQLQEAVDAERHVLLHKPRELRHRLLLDPSVRHKGIGNDGRAGADGDGIVDRAHARARRAVVNGGGRGHWGGGPAR